jgi:hypothetical protein
MHTPIRTTAVALAITIAVLVLPATAAAGGWATVSLSSTPDAVAPGSPWDVELQVLQHGRTPLDDVQPTITIASGETSRTFTTTPTGKPGTYRARVEFPHAGTWRYVIADGFTASHTYPPVRIGAATATPAAGGSRTAYDRLALAALAAIAVAGLAFVLPRRRTRPAEVAGG